MTPPPASPKLDAIFQSMKAGDEAGGTSVSPRDLLPLAMLVCACVLMYVAIKHWHRTRSASPTRVVRSHRKLLSETTRATAGVSRRQLKALNTLAADAGLSSPLVALICPSAISRMAGKIREDRQRVALRALAENLVRAERKRSTAARV